MNTHSGREDEVRQFHKPVRRPSDVLEEFDGSGDPADESSTAHDTAAVLVHLVGDKAVPAVRTRLVEYIAAEGIEDLLELWSRAAIIGRRLGPRWDQLAAELEGCARSWYAGTLW